MSTPPSYDQCQHDLKWLCTSPALLTQQVQHGFMDEPSPMYNTKLAQSSFNHSHHLTNALATRQSQRLGIYYETLWQQWLNCQPDTQLLASNLQVIDGANTLGEFDIIYQHDQKGIVHREVAVKFYLGLPTHTSTSPYTYWIGPNINDRLDKKVNKFLKQMNLSDLSAGKQALLNQGITHVSQREVLLQGYLFYPWQHACAPPVYAHPAHERGLWLPVSALSDFLTTLPKKHYFVPLPKQYWLSRFTAPANEISPFTTIELMHYTYRYFSHTVRPLMVCHGCCTSQYYHEQQRFFIVPNHWLSQARDAQQQNG